MSNSASGQNRATLKMVAAAAGVSTPTVSKVLNGRTDVAPQTRARVEQVLREQDYTPQLRHSGVRSVELVFGDFQNPYFAEILHGVIEAAAQGGIDVVVDRPLDDGVKWANRLSQRGREGAIVVTSELTRQHLAAFAAAGRSVVVIDPVTPKVDTNSIGATNWAGAVSATRHLIDLGHTRIAFLGGPTITAPGLARLSGYRAAMDDAGITLDPQLISAGQFDYASGFERCKMALDLATPPTAIFAAADPIAFGAIEAARLHGLTVPDDLSVVGFDDTFVASWSSPPLTTIHQPLQEMGRAAVRVMQSFAAGSAPDTHHVELATHLVVRGTTAPLIRNDGGTS